MGVNHGRADVFVPKGKAGTGTAGKTSLGRESDVSYSGISSLSVFGFFIWSSGPLLFLLLIRVVAFTIQINQNQIKKKNRLESFNTPSHCKILWSICFLKISSFCVMSISRDKNKSLKSPFAVSIVSISIT